MNLVTIPVAAARLRVSKKYLYSEIDTIPHVTIAGTPHVDLDVLKDWMRVTPDADLASLCDHIGMTAQQLAGWVGVHERTIQRWRIHGMPAHGPPRKKRTRPSEFISWARKYPHVWEQVKL